MVSDDPMEQIIRDALRGARIRFVEGDRNAARLDFYLPDHDLYIEAKQFHNERISEQMSRANNIIVVQGRVAIEYLSALLAQRIEHQPSKLGVDGSNPSERTNG